MALSSPETIERVTLGLLVAIREALACFPWFGTFTAVLLITLCGGCTPVGAPPSNGLFVSGVGNGDASGTWTDHFRVGSAPWRFRVRMNCSRASTWGFDVTLEQTHERGYFDAVPVNLGWSTGQGPASATTWRTVHRKGEFWFIIRAAKGCQWNVRAPAG